MDLSALLPIVQPMLPALLPALAGPAVSLTTEAAKRVPMVPFDPKTTAGIRVAVMVLALAANVALAWLNGGLASFDFQAAFTAIVGAGITYATATATHDHALAAK